MKWKVALVIAALFTMGCTVTIKPIPVKTAKPRPQHSRHHHRAPRAITPKPERVNAPNIKETWWIENYQKLEAAHGNYSISDDANIEPLPDGRFKVPDTVLSHYQDLLMVKPTPKP